MANYVDRISELREDHDYKQKEIADVINVAQTTYSDYERGIVRIPVEYLIRLAEFYNVDMNYLCGVSNVKRPFPRN
ncbi:MAG: helix-turn-helix transcriptional regulator [Clostridiales bacterium]|nr:helix-turn-helix transcriptional regulator [Clostridiales bacterium]MDY4769987.1 helix-turn-helix transcriptional regulator [Lachnospiraceae bacterium]